jgi:hypothetical protein
MVAVFTVVGVVAACVLAVGVVRDIVREELRH